MIPIPENFPYPKEGRSYFHVFDMDGSIAKYKMRHEWMDKGMFAFVAMDWVRPFAQWIGARKVLEVMAGAGWLARALRDCGTSVVATDNYSWPDKREWSMQTSVEKLSAVQSIFQYGREIDILIISWPYMDDHAYYAIKSLYKINAKAVVVYIGEGGGGCTASDKFFEHFDEIADEAFREATANFRQWDGIHDYMTLGKYKP